MPYSETDAQVVAVANQFCYGCDNLKFSPQYPHADGEDKGGACKFLTMKMMIERHKAGTCGLAMVKGVSGTMTLEGFVPEEGGEATA